MTEANHKPVGATAPSSSSRSWPSAPSVALSHGINDNFVHKWRRMVHVPSTDLQLPTFVPVALPQASCAPCADIRVELRRGATSVTLTWPVAAAEHCAAWMRDLLK